VAAPTVVSLHDVQHHDLPGLFSRAERTYRRFAYDRAARSATLVVTQSTHARERVAELAGVDLERIVVVPSGIDHERFRPEGDDDQRKLAGLPLPERFVVYPANAWPHKNHERLIAALAAQDDAELGLVLTGNPYGRLPQLQALAARLGVGDRVRHLGFVPADTVPALYRRALALVFPSLYEGFGTPPAEAMATGTPVASSTRASLAEVCGDAAVTFDPENVESIAAAIARVTGDEALRTELRAKGLANAARFTWSASVDGHLAAYRRAIELGR
jgi:glycosyltransferase involved in cell wall biosynthesis